MWTNRYLIHKWRWRQIMHSLLGLLSLAVTLAGAFVILQASSWKMSWKSWHPAFGFVTLVLAVLLSLGGMNASLQRMIQKDWTTAVMLRYAKMHGIFGYFLIFFSQITVALGIFAIMNGSNNTTKTYGLFIGNVLFFFGGVMIGECYRRSVLSEEDLWKAQPETMSRATFKGRLERGHKLCVLDDMIIDVEPFIRWHPGGKFVINEVVGTDISKYFYGGYNMEGNGGKVPSQGWAHSNYARKIVNDLAVARYEPDITSTHMKVSQDVARTH